MVTIIIENEQNKNTTRTAKMRVDEGGCLMNGRLELSGKRNFLR